MLMREPSVRRPRSVRRPPAEGGQMTALLLFLLSPLAAALQMRSGEFVPLDAPSGFLACPQSLTTREGLGFCIGADPLGATATDVFVQCSAQRIEPEYGDSVMYRFPLVAIDHGVPTFGAPIRRRKACCLVTSAWPLPQDKQTSFTAKFSRWFSSGP